MKMSYVIVSLKHWKCRTSVRIYSDLFFVNLKFGADASTKWIQCVHTTLELGGWIKELNDGRFFREKFNSGCNMNSNFISSYIVPKWKKILAANIWARGTKTAIGTSVYCYHSWKIPRLFKHKKGASPLKLARFKYKIKGGGIENQTLKWNSSILFEK